MSQSQILLYSTPEGEVKIDTVLENETLWLCQAAMAELFDVHVPAISKHLSNIYDEGELSREATISKMETVQNEGNRQVARSKDYYNLDAIIAVGYRVNSKRATQFRIWATAIAEQRYEEFNQKRKADEALAADQDDLRELEELEQRLREHKAP